MNEWTELTKDNRPMHLTTLEYEWQWYKPEDGGWCGCGWCSALIFLNLWKGTVTRKFRSREPEPKQPTHEEIWNKAWYEKYTRVWCRVIGYRNGRYALYNHKHMQCENYKPIIERPKDWFIGRESADIPPE